MRNARQVTAFAPASIGNVGVGFDMLGLAIAGVGDRVSASPSRRPGVSIAEVRGLDGEIHPYLSTDATQNTASIAALALWQAHGHAKFDGPGVELTIRKGVPCSRAWVRHQCLLRWSPNALLETPLEIHDLLPLIAWRGFCNGTTR
jgi:homoserine kinase